MYTPRILSSCAFSIPELSIHHDGTAWRAPAEYEERVQEEWEKTVGAAKTRLWDGTYYRVLNPEALQRAELREPVVLGTIAYRYIATFPALFQEHSRLNLEPLYHLSTVALVRTVDDFYVFGVRRRDGAVELLGGGAQRDEMEIASGIDVEGNLYKELLEEAGLARADVQQMRGAGIVFSSTSNVLMVGHVRLRLDCAEVERAFRRRKDDEMERLMFVSEDEVRQFLGRMRDYRSLLVELDW